MRRMSLAALLVAGGCLIANQANAASEKVLYAFQGGTDGAVPEARLLYSNGVLYGTTTQGGAPYNLGTVFQITLDGAESVLARFPGGDLGATPMAGLTELNGVFYGTTEFGGAPGCFSDTDSGCGVVYGFTPSAGLSPLHVFRGFPTDGSLPLADLTAANGVLFGTTSQGGLNNVGTLFKAAPNARERVLLTFLNAPNGNTPLGGLTPYKGLLYGTLSRGGTAGGGQIFSTDAKGNETIRYNFLIGLGPPTGSLINVRGRLYGVSEFAGSTGCGEVYSFNPSDNSFQIVHTFVYKTADGCFPHALTFLGGKLFGVTTIGGAYNYGSIFEISGDGSERVVHSFGNSSVDGIEPNAALVPVGNTLYGTTEAGGIWDSGTVFSFTPGAD